MAAPIWPISAMTFPLDSTLSVEAVVHPFGGLHEQRVVMELPVGPRADGEGGLSTYIGRNTFQVGINRLSYVSSVGTVVPGNPNIDNAVRTLWSFYKARFFNVRTQVVQWEAFYWYNPDENDNVLTWTGDVASGGVNCFGEAVTNRSGRYLVRFGQELSRNRFQRFLFNFQIELVEVAD